MTVRSFAATGLAVLLVGCQSPPPPAPPRPAAVVADPAGEARIAMARGDWAGAAPLLRQALTAFPDDVALHYNLAICASYLDARDEAIREFTWVLQHAPGGSEEAQAARAWLAEARPVATSGQRPSPTAQPNDDEQRRIATAALSGTVTWTDTSGTTQPRTRQVVMLLGLPDAPTRLYRYRVRTREDGRYEFKNIVPGPYKLTDAMAGQPTWRLRVEVPSESAMVVDLNPGNSAAVRDDFPEPSP